MLDKSNIVKNELLGMPFGTASNRLRKAILFSLVKRLNLDTCFRCSKIIETVRELSIEHKQGWQLSEDPYKSFFDIDNIAFAHLTCNVLAGSRSHFKKYSQAQRDKTHCKHGHELTAENTYWYIDKKGHRLRDCKQCNSLRMRKSRDISVSSNW